MAGNDVSNLKIDPATGLLNYPNTTQTTTSYTWTYCQYHLPCGYCEKLMRDCPKVNTFGNMPQVTYTTEVSTNGE